LLLPFHSPRVVMKFYGLIAYQEVVIEVGC